MNVIEKLLAVQKYDCEIRDLNAELSQIPLKKENELSRVAILKKKLEELEGHLKTALAEVKKNELDIETLREKIDKLRRQQNEIKTNKEYQAMEHEIKEIEANISKLEDQELLAMEKADTLKAEISKQKEIISQTEKEVKTSLSTLEQHSKNLQQRIEELQNIRKNAAAEIPAPWLQRYEIIFKNRKNIAVVKIEDGICGGCHMRLPPSVVNDASKQTEMVTCNYCGRLLYI
jgi:predicted  nucleic acid-binding Zn-ribbon protein